MPESESGVICNVVALVRGNEELVIGLLGVIIPVFVFEVVIGVDLETVWLMLLVGVLVFVILLVSDDDKGREVLDIVCTGGVSDPLESGGKDSIEIGEVSVFAGVNVEGLVKSEEETDSLLENDVEDMEGKDIIVFGTLLTTEFVMDGKVTFVIPKEGVNLLCGGIGVVG
jgi:hypothetical protein